MPVQMQNFLVGMLTTVDQQAVSIVCDTLGWSHSVFDVRAEYADAERYPFASELHAKAVSEFLDSEDGDTLSRFSDVLLLGHDWGVDQEMLLGMLSKVDGGSRPRIGAIGSTVKWNAFREAAIESGVSEQAVGSVRCPIGLDIGADAPDGIGGAYFDERLAPEKVGDDLDTPGVIVVKTH